MPIKKTELDEEFEEAPQMMAEEESREEIRPKEEKIEGEPKIPVESELKLSTERFPEIKNIKVDELYDAEIDLKVKEINDDVAVFEVRNFRLKKRKKTPEEIERDSEGSYMVRE